MVTIPTARDVAYSDPRSGRIANAGPTPMVGAALADAGQAVVQASYSLLDLAEREKIDVANDRSNAVSTSLTRFLADEEQRFLKAREESSESGIGFTRQFMEGHQQRANDFAKANFEGLTKDAQTGYLNNILSRGNSLYEKADDYERQTKGAYYDRTTNTNLDSYRTQIKNNAADFVQLKRAGLEAINSTDMPEPWKAARRQQWEADAAESKWRWKFQQDPKQALADLKPSGTKSLIRDEEGFRAEPYWDVNAWRIGYGSDTVTLADGSHVAVKPGMKITREDAERDLQYRLAEREGARAREQVGAQWNSLSPGTQAALESVAYNYGSLPGSVVEAAKTGDAAAVAIAVEGLSANPARRKREAALIREGGSSESDADYAGIPPERRDVLLSWGETHYQRDQAEQSIVAQLHIDEAATNAPVAIENTGSYSGVMPSEQQFTQAYGDKGRQKFETFQQAIEVSRTAYRMQTMPAAEIAALVKDATPVSTGADAAFEQKRYEATLTAADRTLTARNADPAAYVRQAFPQVDAAWKDAKDEDSYQAAVAASIAAQQKLGVDTVRPLPKAIAADAVAAFNDLERPAADRIAALSHVLETTEDRDQRRILFEQLVDAGLPDITEGAVEAMFRGDDGAARRLFMAMMVDPTKLPGQAAEDPDSIREAIQKRLMAPGKVGDVYYGITDGSAENYLRAQRDEKLIINAVYIRMRNGEALYPAIDGVSKDLFGKVRVVQGDDRVNAEILLREDEDPEVVLDGLAALQGDVKAALQTALKRPGAEPEGVAAGLVTKGNIDLENRLMARKPDGSITTGRPLSFSEDGMEVLIPTVSSEGWMLSNDEAIELYRQTGEFLGKFDSPANAAAYGKALHATLENFHTERASGKWAVRNAIGLNYIDNVMAEGFFRNAEGGFVFINPYLGAPVTDTSGRSIVFTLPKQGPSAPVAGQLGFSQRPLRENEALQKASK